MFANNLRNFLKKNNVIRFFCVYLKKIKFQKIDYAKDQLIVFFRKLGFGNYENLKCYKDKYNGESCFIVCTGPSLTYEDLEKIKGFFSFGMNSIVKVFDKTSWRPNAYGVQDEFVYEKQQDFIVNSVFEYKFIADRIKKQKKYIVPDDSIFFPLNMFGHQSNFDNPKFRYSDDITKCVYDGYSITYSLMQIAIYMGFKKIYILGCDNNYTMPPEKQHFVSNGFVSQGAQQSIVYQRKAFSLAQKYADEHGVKIFNATRGGALEVFPRVLLEDVVDGKE